ncbi:MAG: YeeE/YedE family protein [Deltaproteobacteria bacterium]|nr:YeeE/YedE family protein [Deltaproteobacteria bacterium]
MLFGVSMRWAGGCAAGVVYKLGARSGAALFTILGMVTGATLLEVGFLKEGRYTLQAIGSSSTPWTYDARFILVMGVLFFAFLWRTRSDKAGDWTWKKTSLLLAGVSLMGWARRGWRGEIRDWRCFQGCSLVHARRNGPAKRHEVCA